MAIEELNKKIERNRAISDAKLQFLRDHSKFLDEAFAELKEVNEAELDVIHNKIDELNKRLKRLENK